MELIPLIMVIPFFQNDLYWRFLYVSCNAFIWRRRQNKNLALFPRKSVCHAFQNRRSTIILCIPIQLQWDPLCFRTPFSMGIHANGNCGSPLWTEEGGW
jgi:hypothetical protein